MSRSRQNAITPRVGLLLLLLGMCLLPAPRAVRAQAHTPCSEGGCEPTSPAELTRRLPGEPLQPASPTAVDNLTIFKKYTLQGDYVVAGVGVRGTGKGAIVMSAVPAGAKVLAAYLYWETLGNGQSGTFVGASIKGVALGTVTSPCWAPPLITVYRADVTQRVPASGNGSYAVSFPDSGNTGTAPSTEGASLLIVYTRADLPTRTVVVYDGAYTMFTGLPSFDLTLRGFTAATSAAPVARVTHIVGDGQSYTENLTINGRTFGSSTNPFGGYNGSLWDNPTFDVSAVVAPGDTLVTTSVRWPYTPGISSDCLTWGAVAFSTTVDVGGVSAELVDPVSELLSGGKVVPPVGASNLSILAAKGTRRAGVAADGTARLLVRLTLPSAGKVTLRLTDETHGAVSQGEEYGSLADLFGEPVGDGGLRTQPTPRGHQTFALYIAPSRFARQGADTSLSQRTVFVEGSFTPASGSAQTLSAVPVTIVRPPIVLVHGLWSSGDGAWGSFALPSSRDCRDSGRHYACRADYSRNNAAKLAVIASEVGPQIRDFVARFKKARNVAAVQADVVAHSLGGVITRVLPLCGEGFADCSFTYKTDENYLKGDVGRLVTIGTPHQGSPLAVNLWTHRDTKCTWGIIKVSSLGEQFAKRGLQIGGAIEDLQPDSDALRTVNTDPSPFPISLQVGVATANDENLINSSQGLLAAVRECDPGIVAADIHTVFGEDSDLVVPVMSQRMGEASDAPATVDYSGTIHTQAVRMDDQTGFSPDELSLTALGQGVLQALDLGTFVVR